MLDLLNLTCGFRQDGGRSHFRGIAAVFPVGKIATAREIISLRADRVTAKYRENLWGLYLVVHGESPSPAWSKVILKPAIMKCEKSQFENELLGQHAASKTRLQIPPKRHMVGRRLRRIRRRAAHRPH